MWATLRALRAQQLRRFALDCRAQIRAEAASMMGAKMLISNQFDFTSFQGSTSQD